MDPVLLLVLTAATFRVTRFLASDAFPPVEAFRHWVEDRFGPDSGPAYLAHCPWCLSIYVAAAITAAVDVLHGLPLPVLVALAASGVTGLVATHLDPPE